MSDGATTTGKNGRHGVDVGGEGDWLWRKVGLFCALSFLMCHQKLTWEGEGMQMMCVGGAGTYHLCLVWPDRWYAATGLLHCGPHHMRYSPKTEHSFNAVNKRVVTA